MRSGSLVFGVRHDRGRRVRAGTPGHSGGTVHADGSRGTGLLRDLARMVVVLSEAEDLRSFTLPYPGMAQRALDRTVAHCLDIGETPPTSLPELWEWCRHRTADDRLFDGPASLVAPGATLVDAHGRMPTRTCLELAAHGPDGVATEARVLLRDLAARSGTAARFQRCRLFLARNPVVRQDDRHRRSSGWDRVVWSLVKELYQPVPEFLRVQGVFPCCRSCRLPALPGDRRAPLAGPGASRVDVWCEGEDCPRDTELEAVRKPQLSLVLRRSLRVFLVLPHRTEEDVLSRLDAAGIAHQSVPDHLNAFHVRGAVLKNTGVRVYDRLQPGLLAARLADSPPIADRTLVAVPPRLAERPGYRAAFTAALPETARERLVLTTPDELVHHLGEGAASA
ncbi:hypothetical protein AB0A05_17925 [Streptomyces sp. NPDC046374]|uniref:pPIWI_RE_Y domain-containing protein n=1 Tax=Streptomyces sp. NPDC046374 TaxID=3154917 RepID=UPI0033E5CD91